MGSDPGLTIVKLKRQLVIVTSVRSILQQLDDNRKKLPSWELKVFVNEYNANYSYVMYFLEWAPTFSNYTLFTFLAIKKGLYAPCKSLKTLEFKNQKLKALKVLEKCVWCLKVLKICCIQYWLQTWRSKFLHKLNFDRNFPKGNRIHVSAKCKVERAHF